MPKHPNHPHHHGHADRARRQDGLRLPEIRWSIWGPYHVYPPGWASRTSQGAAMPRLVLFYILTAIITVAAIFACVGGITIWQALTGSR